MRDAVNRTAGLFANLNHRMYFIDNKTVIDFRFKIPTINGLEKTFGMSYEYKRLLGYKRIKETCRYINLDMTYLNNIQLIDHSRKILICGIQNYALDVC